jgi:hypothetical protein
VSEQEQGTDPSKALSGEELTEEEALLAANADVIAAARAKYDEIAILQPPKGFSGIIILAPPENPKTYQTFANNVNKPNCDIAVETQTFAIACVVHPDRAAIKAMFTKRAALAFTIAKRGQELCGSEAKELGKA